MRKEIAILLIALAVAFALLAPLLELTGKVTSRVFVLRSFSGQCNYSLSYGWNLVGFTCVPGNRVVNDTLRQVLSNYSSVHGYHAEDATDPWKSFNPSLPGWVLQDLQSTDSQRGYWIYMKSNSSYLENGSFYTPLFLSLQQGWNLLAFPVVSTINISSALSGGPGVTIIYAFNASSQDWMYYLNATQSGNFMELDHILGYWVNSTSATEWEIG